MSEYAARQALERMNLREVAVASSYTMMASDLRRLSTAVMATEQEKFMDEQRAQLCEAYGFTSSEQRKPFAFANGMAIIPVTGTLINRFGYSWGFITGYNFIRRQLALALQDDDVKGIVFDVNSYGGEAAGCFELSDEIFAARSKKPIIAVIDSNSYSAGYAIASAASKVILTPSGGVGSIGVVVMHVDMSKLLGEIGYKITFIHFGEHKVDGNPYEELTDEVRADIQKSVNYSGEKFVALVARNRNIDAKVVRDTQARVYRAEDAKALGLIDTIATPSDAVQVFFDELTGSESQPAKEDAMTNPSQPAAAAPAAATALAAPALAAAPAAAAPDTAALTAAASTARAEEKARVGGILGCDEAKGKGKLANHLAMNTEMSVDEAKKMLAMAGPETAAAPAQQPNLLVAAMEATGGGPKVGNDNGEGAAAGGEGGEGETAAARILRNQALAGGRKLAVVKN